jgi:hypothetical protein
MKITLVMLFSFFLICINLAGQRFSISDKEPGKTSGLTKQNSIIGIADTSLKLTPAPDLFHGRNHIGYLSPPDNSLMIRKERPHSQLRNYDEEFPGSSVYFTVKSSGMERTNEKFFIMKPDESSKYYLLVKKPLANSSAR